MNHNWGYHLSGLATKVGKWLVLPVVLFAFSQCRDWKSSFDPADYKICDSWVGVPLSVSVSAAKELDLEYPGAHIIHSIQRSQQWTSGVFVMITGEEAHKRYGMPLNEHINLKSRSDLKRVAKLLNLPAEGK